MRILVVSTLYPLPENVARGTFVADHVQRIPCAARATYVVEQMKAQGFLLSTDGPDHNVIKFKPPLVFPESESERLCHNLEQILQEVPLRLA